MKSIALDNEEGILSRKMVSTPNQRFGLVIKFIWILVSSADAVLRVHDRCCAFANNQIVKNNSTHERVQE